MSKSRDLGELAPTIASGTAGQVLTSNGVASPTWVTPAAGATTAYTRTSFTATAGQTSFTVTYTVGFAEVYLNGVLLNSTDYTASTGTTIVLTLAAVLSDIVEVIAYNVATVVGTVTAINATSPITSSGGNTPTIAMPAATTSASGYLTNTDWNTFNGKWTTVTPSTLGNLLVSDGTNWTSQTATLLNLPSAWTKKAADCATTAALTLNTATATIDGVTLSATSRVLVKNQATASQNGIYTGMTTTTWVRDIDVATSGNIAGATVSVGAGTTQFGQIWTNNFKPTDTLGTTAINWFRILDSSQNIVLPAGGTTVGTAPLLITPSANVLVTPEAGAIEVSSANSVAYFTGNTTNGRGVIPSYQFYRMTASGTAGTTTIADCFPATSSVTLIAGGVYEIVWTVYFSKATAGTATFTITNTQAPVNMNAFYLANVSTGITTVNPPQLAGIANSVTAAQALTATSSLSTGVNHLVTVTALVEHHATVNGTIRLRWLFSSGTGTALRGSSYKCTRLPSTNTGIFVA